MNAGDLVLGIDGGGTKTVAWLGLASQEATAPLGRGEGGATNPGVVGAANALDTLANVIDESFADAGIASGQVAAACLAISGTERSAHRGQLLQWAAERQLAHQVQLVNDAEAVLAAGSPDGWGVALIAGTGSFAIGRDLQGLTVRVGGWGYLFGDEGSGQSLAVAALRAAAQDADGRGPATMLLPNLLARFELADPRDLTTTFYGDSAPTRGSLAALAPLVTSAAEQGDEVALQLTNQAATELARLVIAACDALHLSPRRFPLALAGGVLCHSAIMRDQLATALADRDHLTREVQLVEQPVSGALKLAQRVAIDA